LKKIIKQTGTSLGVYFTSEDAKIYGLKVGDVLDLGLKKVETNWLHHHKTENTTIIELESMENYDEVVTNLARLFLERRDIYTTENIVHDNLANDLHREAKWIRL